MVQLCLLCAWSEFGGIFWNCGVCVCVCVCTACTHTTGCYFSAPAERQKVIKIRKNGFNQQAVTIPNPEGFRIILLSRHKCVFRIAILLVELLFVGRRKIQNGKLQKSVDRNFISGCLHYNLFFSDNVFLSLSV